MASMRRSIERRQLKNYMGSNHIRSAWQKYQQERYGYKKWLYMGLACKGRDFNV